MFAHMNFLSVKKHKFNKPNTSLFLKKERLSNGLSYEFSKKA